MTLPLQVTTYVCQECGWADFQAVSQCPRCDGKINPSPITGEGEVVTYTVIRYPPKNFENQAPYTVAIINLKNGPRVIGRISNAAEKIKIGDRVLLSSSKEGTLEFRLPN